MYYACGFASCIGSLATVSEEVWDCIIILAIVSAILFILGIYLFEVIPQGIGVPNHPLFFLCWFKELFQSCNVKQTSIKKASTFQETDFGEDGAEKQSILVEGISEFELQDYAVVVKGLRKDYVDRDKVHHRDLKDVHFIVNHKEVFGILGPNKSGKSSLMSILTGLYRPNSGKAWINGYSISNELHKIYAITSVCPQVDYLWPDLTVEEHLLFYARLSGMPPEKEEDAVSKAIKELRLEKFSEVKARDLSAGTKRQLSVAISLVGDPVIIFLDEPSNNLDADSRSHLWDILAQFKGTRTVVIATSSLEEADAVCERIAILYKGKIRLVGNQTHLKRRFKGVYQIYLNCYKERELFDIKESNISKMVLENARGKSMSQVYKDIVKFIKEIIPDAKLIKAFEGNFSFDVKCLE